MLPGNRPRRRLAIGDASLTGNFTQSRTENIDQDIAYDYTGGFTRLFVPMGTKLSLKADFRRYDIDNDSVSVDVVEQTAPAGLSAGLTYSQAFPNDFPTRFDFVRDSSLNRTPTETRTGRVPSHRVLPVAFTMARSGPMTADDFRELALTLQGAVEGAHMGHPDFRANGRIFASLQQDERTGTVKLAVDEQRQFMRDHPGVFEPASGAWGRQGYTKVHLAQAKVAAVRGAMVLAWQAAIAKSPAKKRAPTPRRRGPSKPP